MPRALARYGEGGARTTTRTRSESTETAFNAQAAAKEGRVTETGPKNLKLGRTGLGGGEGARVFWYKHRVENRRSRMFILGGAELVFILASLGFGFFMRDEGVVPALAFSVYMQMFSSSMRRLPREMMKPYIYSRAGTAVQEAALVPA